jgi:O-succinylhomoserine sulfhydrylase
MSNPTLELVDIRSRSAIAHKVGALVIVDNVFATPIFSRAVDWAPMWWSIPRPSISTGQGRCLGGVVCGTKEFIRKVLEPYLKHTGGGDEPVHRLDAC